MPIHESVLTTAFVSAPFSSHLNDHLRGVHSPRLRDGRRGGYVRMSGSDRRVFFVLGNAGTGKGTQCKMLAKHFRLDHISAGDLLRAEIKTGSKRGEMIKSTIGEGKIVPCEITIELLKSAIDET